MAARWITLNGLLLAFSTLLGILETASAVDGQWSEWTSWQPCSSTCGPGEKKRLRICNNPPASRNGRPCVGRSVQLGACDAPIECPVDGGWGEWSLWTSCSVTCGEGVRFRKRTCDSPRPAHGGRECEGSTDENMMCVSSKDCPRDGKWSSWSQWSACSVTCGDGSIYRYRECNNPPPSQNGRECPGSNQQAKVCKSPRKCSVNGHWSEWSEWSSCSVTCGSGVRQRWRKCDNPPPQNGGRDCNRTEAGEMQDLSCNGTVLFCPVNGGWSDWGEWGECYSPSCGSPDGLAYIMRQRSCNNPYPAHKGSMCQGTFLNAGMCDIPLNCPVDGGWSDWSKWECSKEFVIRRRECDDPPPSNGGKKCPGSKVETYLSEDLEFARLCPKMLIKEDDEGEGKKDEGGTVKPPIIDDEDYDEDYYEDE